MSTVTVVEKITHFNLVMIMLDITFIKPSAHLFILMEHHKPLNNNYLKCNSVNNYAQMTKIVLHSTTTFLNQERHQIAEFGVKKVSLETEMKIRYASLKNNKQITHILQELQQKAIAQIT